MKCSLGISNFLEEISSLSHSVLFLYFFALIAEEGFLISPCYSLELLLWNGYLSFSPLLCTSLLFTAILRPPQTAILLFCISFQWGWSWSLSPVQCHEPLSTVHQALCLSDLVLYICFSLPLHNHKGFDLGPTWTTLLLLVRMWCFSLGKHFPTLSGHVFGWVDPTPGHRCGYGRQALQRGIVNPLQPPSHIH